MTHLSAMLTSLPLPFAESARQMAALGFTHIDPVALTDRPAEHLEVLADTGLLVSCAAVGRDLPAGQTIDAANLADRRAALEAMKRQLADAARLGAPTAYVVPGKDTSADALARFADTLRLLADEADRRHVRLCLEPVPGRALSTAASVLDLLDRLAHPTLAMLLDLGHCLITAEDPVAVMQRAGARLGYVHLDDNDGVGDLHWPLLTGRLTQAELIRFLQALSASGYAKGMALELNPGNAEPLAALRGSREVVMEAGR